jgi:hypothetical protein
VVKTKTHFAFRIDIWDDVGGEIVEHVTGVDDFEVATATYEAAVRRWPAARINVRSTTSAWRSNRPPQSWPSATRAPRAATPPPPRRAA